MRDLDYFVDEILKKYQKKPYFMANGELAERIEDKLIAMGYKPLLVGRNESTQYIAVTDTAKADLKKIYQLKKYNLVQKFVSELEGINDSIKLIESSM